jgi:hypothetical protein
VQLDSQRFLVLGVLNHAWPLVVPVTPFINTKREACYTGLILQKFSQARSLVAVETGPLAPSPTPPSLEQRLAAQALAIDLKEALLACLSGAESRRWTVSELLARLKGLGVPCSRPSVTGALSELELELSLCPWAPWRLVERGQEWALVPKSELAQLLSGVRALPLGDPGRLSDEHKAVLLVVIGHRRKGGVSKIRLGDLSGFGCLPLLRGACLKRRWRGRPRAMKKAARIFSRVELPSSHRL